MEKELEDKNSKIAALHDLRVADKGLLAQLQSELTNTSTVLDILYRLIYIYNSFRTHHSKALLVLKLVLEFTHTIAILILPLSFLRGSANFGGPRFCCFA